MALKIAPLSFLIYHPNRVLISHPSKHSCLALPSSNNIEAVKTNYALGLMSTSSLLIRNAIVPSSLISHSVSSFSLISASLTSELCYPVLMPQLFKNVLIQTQSLGSSYLGLSSFLTSSSSLSQPASPRLSRVFRNENYLPGIEIPSAIVYILSSLPSSSSFLPLFNCPIFK